MKKLRWLVLALVMIIALSCVLVACNRGGEESFLPYDMFEADSYRDYKAEVSLNVEEYSELERQGLRIVTGYSDNDYAHAIESRIDTEELAEQYFNPGKNILVIINGLQAGTGRNGNANMCSDSRLDELEQFEDVEDIAYFANDPNSNQTYDLAKYWFDNGYNVFYFHWEMFADYADNSAVELAGTPPAVQERVWSTDSGVQAVYKRGGNTYNTAPNTAIKGDGSVAELFAAEYMRMADAVSKAHPGYATSKHDVRIAGHSMGGCLSVASATLCNLLVEAGELESGFKINRLALMDSYLGVSSNTDYTISWSGKKYAKDVIGNGSCNYLNALTMLVNKFGVAVEFYSNEKFLITFTSTNLKYNSEEKRFTGVSSERANYINRLCPIILIRPYFAAVSAPVFTNGHNAMREWYLSTILYDAPKTEDGRTVPTARMSDSDLLKLKGTYFSMVNARKDGCETVRCDDDTFLFDAESETKAK